jgi:segregation and condensation protein B
LRLCCAKTTREDLVVIAGRKEDSPGKPLIYATSKSFMDYFGINSPDDLPKIREVLNQEIIEATKIEEIQYETVVEVDETISEKDVLEIDNETNEPADKTNLIAE